MKTTISEKTVLLTRKGIKELKKSIAQLEHEKNMILQYLRESDKTFTREDRLDRVEKLSILEGIESEISDKKLILENSQLLPKKQTKLQVTIGSVVELIDKYGHPFRYMIVDSIEADPSDGKISILSPLGRNLVGKTVRDIIEWSSGKNSNQLQLVRIL
jgi:transcription elongation factor GreA